jgi:hypothetical protein
MTGMKLAYGAFALIGISAVAGGFASSCGPTKSSGSVTAAHYEGDSTDTSDGLTQSQCTAILNRATQLVEEDGRQPQDRAIVLSKKDIRCLSYEVQLKDHANRRGELTPSPYQALLAPLFSMALKGARGDDGDDGNGGGDDDDNGSGRPENGYYRKFAGDLDCAMVNMRFLTQRGELKGANLDCEQGTVGKGLAFECDGLSCTKGEDSIAFFDGEIKVTIGGRTASYEKYQPVILKTGVYTKLSGSWSCTTARIKQATLSYIELALEGNCSNAKIEFDCTNGSCRSRVYSVVLTVKSDREFSWSENSSTAEMQLTE